MEDKNIKDDEILDDQNDNQEDVQNQDEEKEIKPKKPKKKVYISDDENAEEIKKRIESLKNKNNNISFRVKPPIFFFLILILMSTLFYFYGNKTALFQEKREISYTQFVTKVKQGDITEIRESQEKLTGIKKVAGKVEVFETNKLTDRLGQDTYLMEISKEKNVNIVVLGTPVSSIITRAIFSFAPLFMLLFFFYFINKKMMGSSGGVIGNPFNIGKGKGKISERPNVKFSDVAGLTEEKEELKEIVEFLKNPARFEKAGARVPKGVLLLGEPGTGKTLLAKAVAGESEAAFFPISGSEFIELYVGVGASRVRELFKDAKKEAPAIIFIDEIDAVGRRRGQNKNGGGGNEEREQTLNQLLVEMDGFDTDQRIIVMAATNRSDVLDPALLRGGRFDRRIEVSRPDVKGRIEILKVHSRNKKLASDVKLEDIAKITPGFVGADLENLLNEAAILAARKNSDEITMEDLDEAVDKVGMGLGQKSKIISKRDKDMLAYHEGGHALAATLIPGANKVHKVTIIPRGDAGGYMMPLPEETLGKTRKQILAEINVLFAGRAGEELMMDDIATGAYSDIKRATELAKLLISSVGMSELGPINYEHSDNGFMLSSDLSNETAREIDLEVRKLLKFKYEETLNLLRDNKETLEKIATLLKEKETVTGSEIRALVSGLSVNEVLELDDEQLEKYY
ncbi:ATP-dependent zinc metalloprotease FtsH [Streptobacillus moniliformis]|uniref:ATP-dependent zinc metalloprotease FtsH n=1 Tax=Streptobacillus moniliformis TaxID=34105 RepID=UPI0007E4C3D3|nr:ATP-dependent zinc metalloprotease FtsH [Streptobacillus moniliformis]QXW65881.1 ATP-dependent zinc metalloprotease FtsH [Streptobacillus moniliformis]